MNIEGYEHRIAVCCLKEVVYIDIIECVSKIQVFVQHSKSVEYI